MSANTLLVIGAGPLHAYTINAAHALGLHVIATDGNPKAPGFALADSSLSMDTYDIDGHRQLAHALQGELCGAVCSGGDAAPTTAAVAEEANLPGIPFAVAQKTWDKAKVRMALSHAGLQHYQPRWAVSSFSRDDLNTWVMADTLQTYGRCVVKPLSQRASRGVSLIDDATQAEPAWRKAQEVDQTAAGFLIEERLEGTEHSAEVLFDASGAVVHYHVCDRFFSYKDGLSIELGHINPSRRMPYQLQHIKDMLLESAAALGVTFGPFKVDVMWTGTGPKVIEVAARCSGGFDAQVSYPRSSGDNLLQQIIQVACNMPISQLAHPHASHYCAVTAILPRKAGIVERLPAIGGEVLWMIQAGDSVHPPQHCAERAGFVVAERKTWEEAWGESHGRAEAYAEALEEVTT